MSLSILAGLRPNRADDPTFAQQVDEILDDRIDHIVNDPDFCVPAALAALAVETALTVEHLAELLILRPLIGAFA